jgi:hypothetical protein
VYVEFHLFFFSFGAVCRTVVAIDSYEGKIKKSESVEALPRHSSFGFEIGDRHLE